MKIRDQYVLLFLLVCGLLSCIPALTLEYYEFFTPILWVLGYGGIPLLIISIFLARRYVLNIWMRETPRPETKAGRFGLITLFSLGISLGLLFSTSNLIITCDAFIGNSPVKIHQPVVGWSSTTSRAGHVTYYVEFTHPTENRTVHMATYHSFEQYDSIIETMRMGCFGLLSTR